MRGLIFALIGLSLVQLANWESVIGKQIGAKHETGRIEGRVTTAEWKTSPRIHVDSIELFVRDSGRSSAVAKLDESGRFVFEDVPVGRVRLCPVFAVGDIEGVRLGSTLTIPTHIRSGQTNDITYFGKGRPVTGRIVLSDNIDPNKVHVQLTLIAPPLRALRDRRDGLPTPVAKVYGAVQHRTLESLVDDNGRFRIERVREGNYRLTASVPGERLRFAGKVEESYPAMPYGQLAVDFISHGESEDPLDLGTVRFEPVR
jgi:hypothetical protein